MYRKGIGLLAAGSGHNADRSAAPITAAQRSDSLAALGVSATPIPGVTCQPNVVPIGGGAKSVRSVSGDGLT
jgi:hypothetical protein